MENINELVAFLNSYENALFTSEEKIAYFMALTDTAYFEIADKLPQINRNIKMIARGINESIASLKDEKAFADEYQGIRLILDDIKTIPKVILDIMTSLQMQDNIRQCIEHIISSLVMTGKLLRDTDFKNLCNEAVSVLKFLTIMPELINTQLDNVYNSLNGSIYDLSKKFQLISTIFCPPLELEEMVNGSVEMNKIEMLKDALLRMKLSNPQFSKELNRILDSVIEKIEKFAGVVLENSKLLDESSAATMILDQPLAELLLLKDIFHKIGLTASNIFNEVSYENIDDVDCRDKLQNIAELFSTKGEIEAARALLKDIYIEATSDEGDLTLF